MRGYMGGVGGCPSTLTPDKTNTQKGVVDEFIYENLMLQEKWKSVA